MNDPWYIFFTDTTFPCNQYRNISRGNLYCFFNGAVELWVIPYDLKPLFYSLYTFHSLLATNYTNHTNFKCVLLLFYLTTLLCSNDLLLKLAIIPSRPLISLT